MIFVKVYRGINWPKGMWDELSSVLEEVIKEVVKDQQISIVSPHLFQWKGRSFLIIEIFTEEEGYDTRLAIKQKVERRIKEQFSLGGPPPSVPFQVSVLECLRP